MEKDNHLKKAKWMEMELIKSSGTEQSSLVNTE